MVIFNFKNHNDLTLENRKRQQKSNPVRCGWPCAISQSKHFKTRMHERPFKYTHIGNKILLSVILSLCLLAFHILNWCYVFSFSFKDLFFAYLMRSFMHNQKLISRVNEAPTNF